MARPAIAVALPGRRGGAGRGRASSGRLHGRVGQPSPTQLEALLASRRDVAVAILDGETDFDQSLEYYCAPARRRPRHPGADGRLGARARRSLEASSGGEPSRTSTSPGRTRPSRCAGASRRCASAARPSTTARARPPGRPTRRPTAGRAARRSSRSSTRRAASARRPSRRTSPPPSRCARGQQRPARRRRHRDRPRRRRRSASTASEPSPTAGATRPRAARARRSTDIASPHPSGMRVAALTSTPLAHRASSSPTASPTRSPPRAAASTSSSSTCTRPTARSTSAIFERRRPDPRAGHARRAGHPGRRPAAPSWPIGAGRPRRLSLRRQPGQQRRRRR